MTKITKKDIVKLEKRLNDAILNKEFKRAIFLKATINVYNKKLGLEAPQKW